MTPDGIITYEDFCDFYNNPVIQQIAGNKRWTVSTTKEVIGKDGKKKSKMPLDMYALINLEKVWGCAWDRGHHPLVDLQTVCDILPTARNNAYLLDATEDGFVVLDVEGACPEFLKKEFLKLPYKYGEISMSGHGLHLIFDLPRDILAKYPDAATKASMQSKDKDYEILMADHFVTFTRNVLPPSTGELTVKDFENIFESLCSIQKSSIKAESVRIEDIDTSNILHFKEITDVLRKQEYGKTLKDFAYERRAGYDNSAYEHYLSRFYYTCLKKMLREKQYTNLNYSDEEKALIIYTIASEKIPHRDKHDEKRAGMPWLLFLVTRMIAKTDIQDEEWEKSQMRSKYETDEERKERIVREQEIIKKRRERDHRYNSLVLKEHSNTITDVEAKELASIRKEFRIK